jgi:hypothetical protein
MPDTHRCSTGVAGATLAAAVVVLALRASPSVAQAPAPIITIHGLSDHGGEARDVWKLSSRVRVTF